MSTLSAPSPSWLYQWTCLEADAVAALAGVLRASLAPRVATGLRLVLEDHRQTFALLQSLDPSSPACPPIGQPGSSSPWAPVLAPGLGVAEILGAALAAERASLKSYTAHANDPELPARAHSLLETVIRPRARLHPEQLQRLLDAVQSDTA